MFDALVADYAGRAALGCRQGDSTLAANAATVPISTASPTR
jgi:hypothetical protein